MIEETRILPECNADTLLIKFLRGKQPVHCNGISVVAKGMVNKKETCIGIIDKDKFQPKYLQSFNIEIKSSDDLILKQKANTNQYIIFICPAFEKWILKCADLAKVEPQKWGYNDLKSLCKTTKRVSVEEDDNFKNFLNAVIQKNPAPIATMKKWLADILSPKK